METTISLTEGVPDAKQNERRKNYAQRIAVLCLVICLVCMGIGMYKMHADIEDLKLTVRYLKEQQKFRMPNHMTSPNDNGDNGNSVVARPLIGRVTKKNRRADFCSQVHQCQQAKKYESIHLFIDTAKKPPSNNLTQNEKIKKWKLRESDKSGDLTYNENTGEVEIAVSGYYYVYVQLRPAQDTPKIEWFTLHMLRNGSTVAGTSWQYSNITAQSLSRMIYLIKGDKISIKLSENVKYFAYSRFSYFGLHLLPAT